MSEVMLKMDYENIPLACTYKESLEIARDHRIYERTKHEALCLVIVLKDGSEYSFRDDTGMYLSSKLKEEVKQNE